MGLVTKCPVCFTRMNPVGHDLVCPECGYKYCEKKEAYTYDDHNHNAYKSYNQKTSYTVQSALQARQAAQAQSQQYRGTSGTSPSTNRNQAKNRLTPGRIVSIIVIIYFVMVFLSMILALTFSFGF